LNDGLNWPDPCSPWGDSSLSDRAMTLSLAARAFDVFVVALIFAALI
jgi:hypothetical protein